MQQVAKFRHLVVALLLFTASGYANATEGEDHLPLPTNKKKKPSNPFEMVIFNLGRSSFTNPKITNGTFRGTPSHDNKTTNLSVEVPYYKDYTALNFNFDLIGGQQMRGSDITLGVKFRLPWRTRIGYFALTNTWRAGLVSMFYYRNIQGEYESCQFGVTGIPAIGIDYFPIRWVGMYFEYSWTFTNMFLNRQSLKDSHGNRIGTYNNRYSYSAKGLSWGIKFTF